MDGKAELAWHYPIPIYVVRRFTCPKAVTIPEITGLNVVQLRWSRPTLYAVTATLNCHRTRVTEALGEHTTSAKAVHIHAIELQSTRETAENYLLQMGLIPGSHACMLNLYNNCVKNLPDPDPDLNYKQNLIVSSLAYVPPFEQIFGKSLE